MYFQIFAIMIVMWPVEIHSWGLFYSKQSKIISELTKLFSSVVIFVILVSQKNIKSMLSNRYKIFENLMN